MERIVIEGLIARHERVEVINEAPFADLTQHLIRPIATTLPVLPAHPVRYVSFDPEAGRGTIIVEQSPGYKNLRVYHGTVQGYYEDDARRRDDNGVGIWRVLFPWTYWAFPFTTNQRDGFGNLHDFTLRASHLYWSREQFSNPDHPLWVAPVPNVDTDGRICWGGTVVENTSLARRIDDYINSFTTTTFNDHLGHRTPFGTSLNEWERNSPAEDFMAWSRWDRVWNEPHITPAEIPFNTNPPNMAELDPTFAEIPELPQTFTIARARQYLEQLPANTRQRIIAAAATLGTEATEGPAA